MRVVLAEDNALLRAGLVELLRHEDIEVVGEAGDVPHLLRLVDETRPDVAVLDVRMPPTHTVEGLDAARQIRAAHGHAVGILVLSHHVETRYALDLLADGAHGVGYLLKDRVLGPGGSRRPGRRGDVRQREDRRGLHRSDLRQAGAHRHPRQPPQGAGGARLVAGAARPVRAGRCLSPSTS